MSRQPEIDQPTATLYHVHVDAAWGWHDDAGWYYVDDEYPEDSGAVGSFPTEKDARSHAETAWSPPYRVTGDVVVVAEDRSP
jgi:hypothetical protein